MDRSLLRLLFRILIEQDGRRVECFCPGGCVISKMSREGNRSEHGGQQGSGNRDK